MKQKPAPPSAPESPGLETQTQTGTFDLHFCRDWGTERTCLFLKDDLQDCPPSRLTADVGGIWPELGHTLKVAHGSNKTTGSRDTQQQPLPLASVAGHVPVGLLL